MHATDPQFRVLLLCFFASCQRWWADSSEPPITLSYFTPDSPPNPFDFLFSSLRATILSFSPSNPQRPPSLSCSIVTRCACTALDTSRSRLRIRLSILNTGPLQNQAVGDCNCLHEAQCLRWTTPSNSFLSMKSRSWMCINSSTSSLRCCPLTRTAT